jgi:hypothetical protein
MDSGAWNAESPGSFALRPCGSESFHRAFPEPGGWFWTIYHTQINLVGLAT